MTTPTEVAPPYGLDLWKVARVDTAYLAMEQQTTLFAWLTELGVPFRQCRPHLAISQDVATEQHFLHLSRFVLDEYGAKVVDHAANHVHTEPVVYAIADYPLWLVGVSQQQEAEKEAGHGRAGTDE